MKPHIGILGVALLAAVLVFVQTVGDSPAPPDPGPPDSNAGFDGIEGLVRPESPPEALHSSIVGVVTRSGEAVAATAELRRLGPPSPPSWTTLDARPSLRPVSDRAAADSIDTGADGAFAFENLTPGDFEVRVEVEGCVVARRLTHSIPGARMDASIEIFAPAPPQRGRVVTSHGEPVSGLVWATLPYEPRVLLGRPTQADAEGRFVLEGVGAGEVQLHLGRPGEADCADVPPTLPVEGEVLLCVRAPRETVSGVVVADGSPVPGARIVLLDYPTRVALTTDESGHFTYRGPGRVAVIAEGFAPVMTQLAAAPSLNEICLLPAASISGVVRSAADGARLAGVPVHLGFRNLLPAFRRQGETDTEGRFRFDGLPAGEAVVRARGAGWSSGAAAGRTLLTPGHTSEIDIVAMPSARVTGQVVGPDGEPVAGAVVRTSTKWGRDDDGAAPVTATGSSGSFVLRDLAPNVGLYLTATAPGRLRSDRVPLLALPGETLPLILELSPEEPPDEPEDAEPRLPIAGRLRLPAAEPVATGRLQLAREFLGGRRFAFTRRNVLVVAPLAADGAFRFSAVPEGDWILSGDVRQGERVYEVEERVRSGDEQVFAAVRTVSDDRLARRLTFRVVDPNGAPVPRAKLLLADWRGFGLTWAVLDGRAEYSESDPFEATPVSFEVYDARDASGRPLPLGTFSSTDMPKGKTDYTVRLPAERRIRGHVRAPDGLGVAGVVVKAEPAEGSWRSYARTVTDSTGAFTLTALGQRDYSVSVKPEEPFVADRIVRAGPGVDYLAFTVRVGRSVVLRIVGPDGEPVQRARVRIGDELVRDGDDYRQGVTERVDVRGMVRFGALAATGPLPLTVTLPYNDHRFLERRIENWIPKDGEIALDRAYSVQGRMVDPSGRPLAGIDVYASAGEISRRAETDEQGQFRIDGLPPGEVLVSVWAEPGRKVTSRVTAGSTDVEIRVDTGSARTPR